MKIKVLIYGLLSVAIGLMSVCESSTKKKSGSSGKSTKSGVVVRSSSSSQKRTVDDWDFTDGASSSSKKFNKTSRNLDYLDPDDKRNPSSTQKNKPLDLDTTGGNDPFEISPNRRQGSGSQETSGSSSFNNSSEDRLGSSDTASCTTIDDCLKTVTVSSDETATFESYKNTLGHLPLTTLQDSLTKKCKTTSHKTPKLGFSWEKWLSKDADNSLSDTQCLMLSRLGSFFKALENKIKTKLKQLYAIRRQENQEENELLDVDGQKNDVKKNKVTETPAQKKEKKKVLLEEIKAILLQNNLTEPLLTKRMSDYKNTAKYTD